jgi:hypothetical protein
MNRALLFAGALLNLSLALFKIAMPYFFHWREALGPSAAGMWAAASTPSGLYRGCLGTETLGQTALQAKGGQYIAESDTSFQEPFACWSAPSTWFQSC